MMNKAIFWPQAALVRRVLPLVLLALVVPVEKSDGFENHAGRDAAIVTGTWTGSSICVEKNRPQCKNEEVVYRFREVEGQLDLFTLLADKIIDGNRVPMYKLDFKYNQADRTLTCEFTKRQTHGIWQYTVSGNSMTGTLIILPGRTLGRRVSVHRVTDDQVPKAPPPEEYVALSTGEHSAGAPILLANTASRLLCLMTRAEGSARLCRDSATLP